MRERRTIALCGSRAAELTIEFATEPQHGSSLPSPWVTIAFMSVSGARVVVDQDAVSRGERLEL